MFKLLAYTSALLLVMIPGSDQSAWHQELTWFHQSFRYFTRTADHIVSTMEDLMSSTSNNTANFLQTLDHTSYLKPKDSLKHECWKVYEEANREIQSFKIALIKLETPLLKRKLDIKQRMMEVETALSIYRTVADNKYETCIVFGGKNCTNETTTWTKEKLRSLKSLITGEVDKNLTKRPFCEESTKCPDCDAKSSDCVRRPLGIKTICLGEECEDRGNRLPSANCSVESGLYPCSNGKECVPLEGVCDGEEQCEDGSDEGGQCGRKNNCPQGCAAGGGVCLLGPRGATCLTRCPGGLVERGPFCAPGPEAPADSLAELLEGVPALLERFAGAAGYLKRGAIARLDLALDSCREPLPVARISPLRAVMKLNITRTSN